MKLEARPPAKVAVLQNKIPTAMMALRLKRSARNPNGILATARTISKKVCSEPSCASVTCRWPRNKGISGTKTWRAAKLTKLIKASTARRRIWYDESGMDFVDIRNSPGDRVQPGGA